MASPRHYRPGKGNDTKSRLKHNFGSPRPEGYRKAIRVLELLTASRCRS